jgi:hypothetical protein
VWMRSVGSIVLVSVLICVEVISGFVCYGVYLVVEFRVGEE